MRTLNASTTASLFGTSAEKSTTWLVGDENDLRSASPDWEVPIQASNACLGRSGN